MQIIAFIFTKLKIKLWQTYARSKRCHLLPLNATERKKQNISIRYDQLFSINQQKNWLFAVSRIFGGALQVFETSPGKWFTIIPSSVELDTKGTIITTVFSNRVLTATARIRFHVSSSAKFSVDTAELRPVFSKYFGVPCQFPFH
jgi:hypothetical protein